MVAELFHPEKRTDRQTDMAKLIYAFLNFGTAHYNWRLHFDEFFSPYQLRQWWVPARCFGYILCPHHRRCWILFHNHVTDIPRGVQLIKNPWSFQILHTRPAVHNYMFRHYALNTLKAITSIQHRLRPSRLTLRLAFVYNPQTHTIQTWVRAKYEEKQWRNLNIRRQ
jgi:hypothetical protein